jgi:formylglycine-generating enzyme required for sulfatase activity
VSAPWRGAAAAVLLASAGLAALLAACFPDYAVGDAGAEGGLDARADGMSEGATSDGTVVSDGPIGSDSASQPDVTGDTAPGADAADSGAWDAGDAWTGFDGSYDGPIPTGMALIEGGTFHFQVALASGTIDATATLNYTIAVDQYPVTIGRFGAWVSAGMPLPEAGASLDPGGPYESAMTWDSADWDAYAKSDYYDDAGACGAGGTPPAVVTYTAANLSAHPDYPANCMTWAQALAFCWWDNRKRLPTDTEWRVVATSEGTRMPYPWGAATPASCSQITANFGTPTNCGFPIPVGSAASGVTRDGVYDIVGSVSEWLWDFAPTNPYSYPSTPPTNYAGPPDSNANDTRVYIGAEWYATDPAFARSIQPGPDYGTPTEGFDGNGFRCAQTRP